MRRLIGRGCHVIRPDAKFYLPVTLMLAIKMANCSFCVPETMESRVFLMDIVWS